MKEINFEVADYIGSFLEGDKIPLFRDEGGAILKEIAFIGRSNVGKSSLINTLTKKRSLAKTSSTPGKTKTINFFNIDQALILVDLPGYGYAASDHKQKALWAQAIDAFLKERKPLFSLFLLLDIRRELTLDDCAMLEFCKLRALPTILIFTKCDKLSKQQGELSVKKNLLQAEEIYGKPLDHLLFSTHDQGHRQLLIKKLQGILHGSSL